MNKRGPWALAGLALLVAGAHWAALAGLAPALAAPAPLVNAPRAVWVAAVPPGIAARGNATSAGAAKPSATPPGTAALLVRAEASTAPAAAVPAAAAAVVRIAAPRTPSSGAGQGLAESVPASTGGADTAPLQPDVARSPGAGQGSDAPMPASTGGVDAVALQPNVARPGLASPRLGLPAPTPDSLAPTSDSAPMSTVVHAKPAGAEALESSAAPMPQQAATPTAPLRIAASAADAMPAAIVALAAPSAPAAALRMATSAADTAPVGPAARAASEAQAAPAASSALAPPAARLRIGAASPSALPASAAVPDSDAGEGAPSKTPTAAPPAAPAPPVYATRIPPAARVLYRMSRSGIVGTGELDWRPQGTRSYVLTLEGRLPIIGALIVQTSRGGFDAAGLAPERFTDKRLRRGEQAANFQRQAGKISFSGPSTELPLLAGVQDRLSVMLQLAAIAGAWRQPHRVGERFVVAVVGARGDSHLWSLRYEGRDALATPEGSVSALRFVRVPEGPYDTLAEFWLDAARSYLPVRVRLTDGKGDALELLREAKVP